MREPRAMLPLVDAELLETVVEVGSERGRAAAVIVEHQHPDAARLAVAAQPERRPGGSPRSLAQALRNGGQFAGRAAAEEGERDVQVSARDHADVSGSAEDLALPPLQPVERLGGEAKPD